MLGPVGTSTGSHLLSISSGLVVHGHLHWIPKPTWAISESDATCEGTLKPPSSSSSSSPTALPDASIRQ